jgi:hypothetical protein
VTIEPKSWKALRRRMATDRLIAYPSILPSAKHRQFMNDIQSATAYMLDALAEKNPPPPTPRPGEAIKVWWDEAENLPKYDRVVIGVDFGREPASIVWHPRPPKPSSE